MNGPGAARVDDLGSDWPSAYDQALALRIRRRSARGRVADASAMRAAVRVRGRPASREALFPRSRRRAQLERQPR
jgi:hypothetical protein